MKLQSVPLGNGAADAFLLLDDASVGRIVRALCYYSFLGQRPAVEKALRPTFYLVYAESCRVRGVKPNRPQAIPFVDTPEQAQSEESEEGEESEESADEMRREEKRISSDVRCPDVARERASRPSSVGVGLRSSVDSSIRIPSPSENFVVWAKLQEDPVDVAMCATGETDKRARRTYGAQLKRLGRERFVDLVCDFRSTLADEPPRNKGATLTAFLRDTP